MEVANTWLAYIVDFLIVMGLIIGITALIGVITNSIGNKLFGGNKKSEFVDEVLQNTNWLENCRGQKNKTKKTISTRDRFFMFIYFVLLIALYSFSEQ